MYKVDVVIENYSLSVRQGVRTVVIEGRFTVIHGNVNIIISKFELRPFAHRDLNLIDCRVESGIPFEKYSKILVWAKGAIVKEVMKLLDDSYGNLKYF